MVATNRGMECLAPSFVCWRAASSRKEKICVSVIGTDQWCLIWKPIDVTVEGGWDSMVKWTRAHTTVVRKATAEQNRLRW